MSAIKGQYLLELLSEINEPVRLEDIVEVIMPRLQFTRSLLLREIKESLEAGVRYGYVQKCNNYYYSIKDALNVLGEKIEYMYEPNKPANASSDEEETTANVVAHSSATSKRSLVLNKSKTQQKCDDDDDDDCQRPSKLLKTNSEHAIASKSRESTKAPSAKASSDSSDCEGGEVADCAQCRRPKRKRSVRRRRRPSRRRSRRHL